MLAGFIPYNSTSDEMHFQLYVVRFMQNFSLSSKNIMNCSSRTFIFPNNLTVFLSGLASVVLFLWKGFIELVIKHVTGWSRWFERIRLILICKADEFHATLIPNYMANNYTYCEDGFYMFY